MISCRGEPLLLAEWERVLMLHFEVDAEVLQREVPYQLDLQDGRAFVSLVAFTMRGMRPRLGGRLTAALFRPIATHDFLNVCTYVRHGNETGIHFLAEWLSNRLAVTLGPPVFGLPYRFGRIAYQHKLEAGGLSGRVQSATPGTLFEYRASMESDAPFAPCERGSLDEWLMERYTAFNSAWGRKIFFRVWHPPWPQVRVQAEVTDHSLLSKNWPWFREARFAFANFSPGVCGIWMGRPERAGDALIRRDSDA